MFFMRLRRGTKPIFVLLVIVFGFGFVLLGVGSGSSGIGDLFQGNFGNLFHRGGNAISKAEKEVAKHPKDSKGYRDLATAYTGKGRREDAIVPLERYLALRPRDREVWVELGGDYIVRAQRYYDEVLAIQAETASLPSNGFGVPPTSFLAKELQKDPLSAAIQQGLSQRRTAALSNFQAAGSSAVSAYKKAVALSANTPDLPTLLIQLGQTAEGVGDIPSAIAAYKRFLKVAPDSPDAPLIRKRIKQLQASQRPPASSSASQG